MNIILKDKKIKFTIIFGCLIFGFGIISSAKVKAMLKDKTSTGLDEAPTHSVSPLTDNITPSLPFIKDSICLINDTTNSMSAFINELNDLYNGKDTVINIVHLGDSHIQAGFLSGRTMRLLQNAFGNAGRGWIAPFKLSKVNEPVDYFISSNIKEWIAGRCIQTKPKCPWGIGGIGIQTEAGNIDFKLSIAPNNGAGYGFNKILLYRDYNAAPMAPLTDKDSTTMLSWGHHIYENIVVDTFMMASLNDTFSIRSVDLTTYYIENEMPFADEESAITTNSRQGNTITKNPNTYYGFMLTNSSPGVLYHSIGVNGAKFKDYTSREYVRQLSLLKPSLLIISLGTNESFGRNFSKTEFETQVDSFVRLVHEEIPGVTLLITTPVESYKHVYRNKKRYYERNINVAKVTDVITTYAKKEGIAYWDLYSIAGGDNSCKKWFDAKMFGRDRIHFSRVGYEEQGTLLYKAILRSCISAQKTENLGEEEQNVE